MNGMHYHDGLWRKEPPRVAGPTDLGFWSGNSVFDGARAIRGCAPDLDRHCARLLRSAAAIGLRPALTDRQVLDLCVEGIRERKSVVSGTRVSVSVDHGGRSIIKKTTTQRTN